LDRTIAKPGLPETPREFAFYVVGAVIQGGDREMLKRARPAARRGVYGVEEYTQIKSVHIETGERDHWIR
jgi:hypothetical protein